MLGALFAKREVRKGFKAMMRHDADTLMGMIHDDGVLEFPGSTVLAGRYEGKEAFERGSSAGSRGCRRFDSP